MSGMPFPSFVEFAQFAQFVVAVCRGDAARADVPLTAPA